LEKKDTAGREDKASLYLNVGKERGPKEPGKRVKACRSAGGGQRGKKDRTDIVRGKTFCAKGGKGAQVLTDREELCVMCGAKGETLDKLFPVAGKRNWINLEQH